MTYSLPINYFLIIVNDKKHIIIKPHTMKKIILLVVSLLALRATSCVPDIAPEQISSTENKSRSADLSYELKQDHFTSLRQIIHTIVLGSDQQPPEQYRFVDVHVAWLVYSDGGSSNYKVFEICHNVSYNKQLSLSSPQDLLGKTFTYQDGFKFADNTVWIKSEIESFDDVSFTINNQKITFSQPELQCCELLPISLTFSEYDNNVLKGTMYLVFASHGESSDDALEFPVAFDVF